MAKGRGGGRNGGGSGNGKNFGALVRKIFYYSCVVLLGAAAITIYFSWFDLYNYTHPTVFQTEFGVYTEELPFEGILLWDERVVRAPKDGDVSFSSQKPRRVRSGETLCTVGGAVVRAQGAGYFIPATDGLEGNWAYSMLWTGTSSLPEAQSAVFIENGSFVGADEPVGKLIPQPQELRCIAWIDVTPSLLQDIARARFRIKTRDDDWGMWAEVRTSQVVAQRAKVYLTLPFFTPDMLTRRSFSWKILVGERHGIYVPNTAVIFRDGVMGVYIVRGNDAVFRKIEAFHADEESFFITSGVTPGDLVILNAARAREGQVNIW